MTRHRTRTPGIYWREDSKGRRRYQISYIDSIGQRVFKRVPGNERDAQAALRDIKTRMHRGEKVIRSNLTVSELFEDYLKTQTWNLKESTKRSYGYFMDRYVLPRIGKKKAVEVDVNVVADLIADLNQGLAANTVKNCLKPLSRMFAYSTRRGWTSHNPVAQLDRNEMPKGSPRRMRILDTDEINRLLRVKTVYRTMFLFAIFTGLRRGECLSLTWADVDLLGGTVNVREGKTEAAVRQVVMPDFLVQELARLNTTEGRVFPFQERNVNRALEAALTRAKVEQVRFHDLRHTYASIQISLGMDVVWIAGQMGHSNPAITLNTYSHLFDAEKRQKEAREKMQESFGTLLGTSVASDSDDQ